MSAETDDNRIGCKHFEAEAFHVDFTGRLSMWVLGNELLNCADAHAEQRGFGMTRLNGERYTWVLSRLVVEMKRMPVRHEKFCIRTWIEGVYRLFTDRNFEVVSDGGEVLGCARSIWAMIDMESRKPADLIALHGERLAAYACGRECPIARPGRIRVRTEEPVKQYAVQYSDLDINGHVNSVKYMQHVLDLFPPERFARERVGRFEIAYHAESRYGDTLSLFREETDEGGCAVEIRKGSGDTVCRAQVKFINS